jgi:hypothetical protein
LTGGRITDPSQSSGETFVYHLWWGPKCEIKSSPSAKSLWKAQGKEKEEGEEKKSNRPKQTVLTGIYKHFTPLQSTPTDRQLVNESSTNSAVK